MKKTTLCLCLCLLFVSLIQAQNRTITGTVLNEENKPLSGASILIKKTSRGATADDNGKFSLTVSAADKTLVVSLVGYTSQEITIGSSLSYEVQLKPTVHELDEVVLTAYGSTQKKSFTGTAATISNEKFKDLQVTTVTGILQGNASGVLAVATTGQPGENPTIRIRGIGSFNATNDPLIVLDGAPYSGSLNSINPADVETITILKDASSTSIYGSRASNGIIQITTKKGRGKAKFGFSNITGFSNRAIQEYKTLSAKQYYELTWEALRNDAIANAALPGSVGTTSPEAYASKVVVSRLVYNPFSIAQPVGLDGKLDPNAKQLWNDNWIDAVTRTSIRNDMNFNVSGSDAANTIRYYLSAGYLHDQGTTKESDFKRYTGRIKVDATPVQWFRIGMNGSVAYSNQNYPYQGNAGASNQLSFARNIAAIFPIYLRDAATGNYILDAAGNKIYDFGNNSAVTGVLRPTAQNRPYNVGQNPVGTTSINPITNDRITASSIGYAEADLWKGLVFKSQYAIDYNQVDNNLFWNPFYGDGTTSGGYSYRNITNTISQNFTNTFTYDKNFSAEHHLNVVAGMESYKQRIEYTTVERTGFTFAYPTQPSYGTTSTANGSVDGYHLESFFGLAKYDLFQKYHFAFSLRSDGSTRFADSVRWGTFYSIGASWNLNREKFMSGISYLSDLKLKASYGTSGNQGLPGSFPYLGTYAAGANIGSASGSIINTVANFDLTWETQKQLDMGVEFGFLNNKITGSFVYFRRESDKLLFSRPLPGSTGINSIQDNTGGVRNSGYEVELTTVNVKHRNFEWRTSFNITFLKNQVTIVPPGTTYVLGGSWYDWYLPEYAGVDAADGSPMWYMDDVNGKKVTTKTYSQATYYHEGSRLANYTGGITNFINYKDFDLTVLASFSLGGKMYDVDYAGLMGSFNAAGSNESVDVLNRWQSAANPGDGKTPKLSTSSSNLGTSASTRFLYDLSYMRIRNITLGYRLPASMLKKAGIGSVRIFADLQNPFTFFGGVKGTDPEAGINAQTGNNNTTTYKTFSLGINVGF